MQNVHTSIVSATAATTWANLQTQFASEGISSIYQDFRAAMAVKIGTSNPAKDMRGKPSCDLWVYSGNNAAECDPIMAYYVQMQQAVSTITFSTIWTTILSEFKHSGGNHNNNQAHTVDKILAVKRKGKSSNFQKQKGTAEMEAGTFNQKKCCLNHCAKEGKSKGNSHQHSYLADRLEKVELGQLQLAPALQHPMITLQPSWTGSYITTIVSIKLNSVTYVSKSTNTAGRRLI